MQQRPVADCRSESLARSAERAQEWPPAVAATALFCLPSHNPLRRLCLKFASSWWLSAASLLVTLAFCVLQCFWNPLEPSDTGLNHAIDRASLGVTLFFTVEIGIKCLAWGFVLDDGESFGSAWAAVIQGLRSLLPRFWWQSSEQQKQHGRAAPLQLGEPHRMQLPERLGVQLSYEVDNVGAGTQQQQQAVPPGGIQQQQTLQQYQDNLSLQQQQQQQQCQPGDPPIPAAAQDAVADDSKSASACSAAGPAEVLGAPHAAAAAAAAADVPTGGQPKGGGAPAHQLPGRMLSARLQRLNRRQRPFLRSGWNRLDFVVVLGSWITFLPGVGEGAAAARSLRLMLALRSLTLFPGMKACATALLQSIPMLLQICLATLFLMWLFAIIGLQFYQNPLHQNCFVLGPDNQPLPFTPAAAANTNGSYTPAANEGVMCSTLDFWAGPSCPAQQACLQQGQPPQFGQLNFNNVAAGIAFCFFIITALYWGQPTSYLMEATVGWSFFFSLVQVLVGWFMLSLVLAVLGDKYLEAMRDEKRQQREEEEEAELFGVGVAVPVGWVRRTWDCLAARAVALWRSPLPGCLARSRDWRWRRWLLAVVRHWAFEAAVISSVLANTVVLGMPYYGMSDAYASRLSTANSALTWCFVAEAALKVSAWGRAYFEDPFNLYDFFVTAVALASFFIEQAHSSSPASGLSGLRAVRILRLLRLLTVLPALQRFLRVLVRVLLRTLAFFGIVALTVVLFALLGMLTLGGKWDPSTDPDAPRLNFNSFGSSLATVFNTLTGSLEDSVFYAMYKTHGWAVLYYVALTVLGNFLVLNLLIAILYELFLEELEGAAVERSAPGDWLLLRKLRQLAASSLRLLCCRPWLAVPESQRESSSSPEPPPSVAIAEDEQLAPPSSATQQGSESLSSIAFDQEGGPLDVEAAPGIGGTIRLGTAAPGITSRTTSGSSLFKDKDKLSGTTSRLSSFQWEPPRQQAGQLVRAVDARTAGSRWRKAGAWLLGLLSNDPQWKGAVGAPLSSFQHRSLWLLAPDSRLRRILFSIVDDQRFEFLVLLVILFNCGVMAVESPGNSDHLAHLLASLEWGCLAFYIAEMAVKLLALGAWAEGPGRSYFRSPWNWLDFTVVVTSLLAATLAHVGWVQALRLLRVLRPLRLIGRSKQMRAVVGCLLTSILSMLHVLAVAVLVQLVFSILGMQLFMGELHYCTSTTCCPNASDPSSCVSVEFEEQCTGSAADGSPCLWVNTYYNFDNLWNSLVTLTVLMTGANWSDSFFAASDTVGQGMQMQTNASTVDAALFFTIYQCIAQFFIFNLFISVVLDAYSAQIERQGMGVMLTEGQREWVKAQLHLLRDLPERRDTAPRQPWRRRLYTLVTHPAFDWCVVACVLASGVAMSLQHYNQPNAWDQALAWTSNAFTIVFCLESALKLAALYPARYFGDAWNCFDFLVTWGSLPSIFLESGPAVGALRALRALRIARTVKHARGLRRIATTLFITLPTLLNAALVFALFLFMFAVLGTQLFYGVHPSQPLLRQQQGMTVFFNFQNVGNAIMMLTDAATGDNWEKYQQDTMLQPPDCDPALGECGSNLATLFWLPFMVVCSFLLLSIVLAVVVDAYAVNREPPQVSPENIQQFKDSWSELDPAGVGFINVTELHHLLERVDHPLGYRGHPKGQPSPEDTQRLASSLLQIDTDGSIYYHEVLQALTARAADISISSLGHRVQQELREETRQRKERQRQRQQQLRRRQLQRQQRMHRSRHQSTDFSALRSVGALSRFVETISRAGSGTTPQGTARRDRLEQAISTALSLAGSAGSIPAMPSAAAARADSSHQGAP